ncbi:MAG: hypothetical protein HYU28_07190 [Actinobacteria bacterium]|nr:hypothetical protein [Actinomycetota bacterium]
MARPARVLSLASLALAGFMLAGCGVKSGPDAGTLIVHGSVAGAGGIPRSDVDVVARHRLDAEDVQTVRLSELDSLGFACIDERPPRACGGGQSASVDDQGVFSLEVGDTVAGPVVAGPEPLIVALHAPPGSGQLSGPAVSRDVLPAGDGVDLGAVEVWDPALQISPLASGDAALRWEPAAPGAISQYEVLVENSNGDLVWDETTKRRELTLLHQHLADTKGAVSVVALGADPPLRFRSARIPYRADGASIVGAAVGEVGWPKRRTVPPEMVLVAIVSFMLASVLLVTTTASRHRQQMRRISLISVNGRFGARG